MLRENLSENDLLGKILRAHHDRLLIGAAPDPSYNTREEARGGQAAENLRSAHPSPPSAGRAMAAAGMAPARISVVSTEASPRKMKTPRPPPPMAAAIVAVPIVVTVATRRPARMVLAAKGSSTSHNSCRPLIPIATADSRTAGPTPRIPAS